MVARPTAPSTSPARLYCPSSADITKANTGDWGRVWVDTVGAAFAVSEEDLGGGTALENAMAWDPDVVVQGGSDLPALLDGPTLQGMKAIRAGEVHSCPIGGFWWDRPSPEVPLRFLWLAQTVFPGYFDDIDLEQETIDFFKRFYSCDLPQDENEAFFGWCSPPKGSPGLRGATPPARGCMPFQVEPVHVVKAGNMAALKAKLCEGLTVSISLACTFGDCFIQPRRSVRSPVFLHVTSAMRFESALFPTQAVIWGTLLFGFSILASCMPAMSLDGLFHASRMDMGSEGLFA